METQPIKSLDDVNLILSAGYPSNADLGRFPLAELLQRLDRLAWTQTARVIELQDPEPDLPKRDLEKRLIQQLRLLPSEKLGEVYRQHAKRTMEGINLLIERRHDDVVRGANWNEPPLSDFLTQLLTTWVQNNQEVASFLRLVALYHDIGKVFHRDRHAILGRHIIESPPNPNADDDLRKFHRILGDDDELFSQMIRLIGYHDLYGVLCTGEASRPVLIDVAGFKPDADAWKALGYLFVLNIADIYGTLPDFVPSKLDMMAEDWSFVSGLLPSSGDSFIYRKVFENRIFEDSQHPAYAAERIWRLLTAALLMLPVKSSTEQGLFDTEAERQRFTDKVTPGVVRDALTAELGPGLGSFCNDFALVCKFDYTLRFIVRLSHAWVSHQFDLRERRDTDQLLPSELAAIVVELFVRLVNNYRDLTVHRRGWSQRIGIELMGLTRSREIEQRVIDLLLGPRRAEGINWAADEATAWYFV